MSPLTDAADRSLPTGVVTFLLTDVEGSGTHWSSNPKEMAASLRDLDSCVGTIVNRNDGTVRWAVELRDPSWIHDDVFAVLERHGAALCIHDLLPRHPWLLTTSWTYIRFHGPDAQANPYHGRYGGRRLGRASRTIREWLDAGTDVFASFNSDFDGHAVVDAEGLRRSIDSDGDPPDLPAPGSVVPGLPNADPWSEHHVATTFQREVVAAILRRAPGLPWWRVVPTDSRLYRSHAPTQAPLLEAEGHRVDGRRRVRSR